MFLHVLISTRAGICSEFERLLHTFNRFCIHQPSQKEIAGSKGKPSLDTLKAFYLQESRTETWIPILEVLDQIGFATSFYA